MKIKVEECSKEAFEQIRRNILGQACIFKDTTQQCAGRKLCRYCLEEIFEWVEPPRWRAEKNGEFYTVSSTGYVESEGEYKNPLCDAWWEAGNYFKTEEEAKASKFYKVFHNG